MTTAPVVDLVLLEEPALRALAGGDLVAASAAAGVQIPPPFLDDARLWRLRVDAVRKSPEVTPWLPRAIVVGDDRVVVGHAGFHGPPDDDGMVEVGYSVLPEHRRRGHARAALAALIAFARERGARTVRASISPDNAASQALVASFGFAHVGEQWDEEDGRELVFERPAA